MFLSLESPPPLLRVHAALSPVGQFGITLYLLYWQIGVSFLSGLVFAIALVPLNKWIANKTGACGGGGTALPSLSPSGHSLSQGCAGALAEMRVFLGQGEPDGWILW